MFPRHRAPADFQEHRASLAGRGLLTRERRIERPVRLRLRVRRHFEGDLADHQRPAFRFAGAAGATGRDYDIPDLAVDDLGTAIEGA